MIPDKTNRKVHQKETGAHSANEGESQGIREERTEMLVQLNEELKREVAERRKAEQELEQRTHLLSTLLDVSNLVSSTLELKPLLESILDRLKKIIPYKGAKIVVIEGYSIRVIAHRGPLKEEVIQVNPLHVMTAAIIREIIHQKKPVVIPDILSDDPNAVVFRQIIGEHLNTTFKNSRSWLGIPLIMKDRVLGALTVDYDEPDFYHPHHIELGMAFANQVAIEFENARLYNETIKRADELKTMFSVQQAITSRLDRDYVLQLIADESRRLTNCARTAVFLVDGEELVLCVFSGMDSRSFLGYRMRIDSSMMGKAMRQGQSLIVNDAQENKEAYEGLVEKANVKSFLSVPLVVGVNPIGTVAVVDKISGEFRAEDERILSMLASVAVIGLENSRMYQEEQRRHLEDERRRHVAEGLRDVLTVLNSNKPLPEILDFIIIQALKLLGTDTGALYRLQSDKGVLRIEAARGLPEEYIAEMMIPVGAGLVGQSVALRKPIAVANIKESIPREMLNSPSKIQEHLRWVTENFHASLAVPLICKDEIYGGIVLYYQEAKDFSQEEIELAMTFADQTALAIDNARLRAQAEEVAVAAERSRLARDLHDAVTQTLFSSSLIAEVLPKIWEKNPIEGKKRLDELRQLTRGALAEMRTLLLELRPSALTESGLKELLTQLTQAVMGRSRIPIQLTVEGQPNLPPDVKIAFYRIAQEALNNITKHSRASQVRINLLCTDKKGEQFGDGELRIEDNGCGFEIEKVTPEHLGLGIMRERAEAVGADFQVESRSGEGTVILVSWGKGREESEND
ncbi:MAG: GAF domain-containing protein [Clostridia bacterium]|nr:GAF domain-containing protein [Clostridia bacterium]